LKVSGIIISIGGLLFLFHKEIPVLQNIHPVVFGFVLVVSGCIFFNFLAQKRFGPTKRKGKYLPLENQLCFRFLIRECSDYHRILLRNDMTNTVGGLSITMTGDSASTVKMNIPDIAENYIILSKSETEIKEIISKIQYELRKLVDIFPSNGQNFVLDSIPANLDVHITRNEVLARIPYQKGWLIDRLYFSFKEIQSILGR